MSDYHHVYGASAQTRIEDRQEITDYEKQIRSIQALLIEKEGSVADELCQKEEVLDASPHCAVCTREWVDKELKVRLLAATGIVLEWLGIDTDRMITLVALKISWLFIFTITETSSSARACSL